MLCLFIYFEDLKSSLRKLEHENADLRFLNNQYIHKMRSLELDSKQKTERILQLQEKNFHAVVQTPGELDQLLNGQCWSAFLIFLIDAFMAALLLMLRRGYAG